MRALLPVTAMNTSRTAMEEAFGCAVANRFMNLLDDETDPLDFLKQAAEEKSCRKKKEAANSGQKSGNKKESQKDRKAQFDGKNIELLITHTGHKPDPKQLKKSDTTAEKKMAQRSGYEEFPSVIPASVEFSISRSEHCMEMSGRGHGAAARHGSMVIVDKQRLVRNWISGRTGMRGRGRGGFPRQTDSYDQRGKREYDRHSGSDRARVRPEDKRGGSGSHNWGTFKDSYSDAEPNPIEDLSESNETGEICDFPGEIVDCAEEMAPSPDEIAAFPKEMTLDEWKNLQDLSRPKLEFNLRKPDASVPSKAVVIHKSKFKNTLTDEDFHCAFRKPVNDITSQLDINFGALPRPGRGGRGGGRGRARGEEIFIHAVANIHLMAPNPDDPEDFPALA
ncbi:intracellular hyaluronan-binding protein 4 [Pelodytes ibericus]